MSTYLYLTCESHDPPLRAHEESGQHLYDLPRIREEIQNRKEIARIEDEDLPCSNPFVRHSAYFLSHHKDCTIGIVDEYGRTHDVTDANNPHNVKVGQIWGDCDPRMGGREFKIREVGETHATVVITRPNDYAYSTRLVHRIKLTRFKPTSTGYRLIEDVK